MKTQLVGKTQVGGKGYKYYPVVEGIRSRSFIQIPKDLVDVEIDEDLIWTRVVGFGAVADRLNKLLEAGATGLEFSKLGQRDNSFHDAATQEDVEQKDLVCGQIKDIHTKMPRGGSKKKSSAI